MVSFNQRFLRQIDWWLIGAVLALTAIGIVVIDGTTHEVASKRHFAERQIMWWGVAVVAFAAIVLIDYRRLAKLSIPAYLGCLGLLAGLLFKHGVAVTVHHATSWYDLGVVRLQPSELTKIAVILLVSAYLARIKTRLPGWLDLALVAVLVGLPMGLILLQPDFGTAATFLPILAVLPWAAGVRRRVYVVLAATALIIGAGYGSAVVARGGDYPGLKPYQEDRINSFLGRALSVAGVKANAELDERTMRKKLENKADWAPMQARIALGSGGMFGKGWRRGTQTHLEFLPEAHNDYIFASCGEQFGFLGCALVLALYALIIVRSLTLAVRARDWFGYLIIYGVAAVFVTHIFLNTGVATDLLPATGLPLPFLSAGGSFLVTTYIGFALVVNVGMRKQKFANQSSR
jgi:rod shape determining protein RodA